MNLSEYARSRGISKEAVSKKIKKYQQELKGHTKTSGRALELDEFAVQFLDQHTATKQVIIEAGTSESKLMIDNLKQEIAQRDAELKETYKRITELLEDNQKMLVIEAKNQLLIEEGSKLQERIIETETRCSSYISKLSEVEQELQECRSEADSYHKSIFGLYRKRKK